MDDCAYQKPHPAQLGRPAFRSSPRFTLVERKTQLTKIVKLPRATARATQKAAVRRLKPIGDFVHTITFDNGKEFAAHQDIASVKGRTDPCYSKISLRFSSNSALSISPLAKRSFKISKAREAVSYTSGSSSRHALRRQQHIN
jgi:hypothetical protein